MEIEIKVI